MCEQNFRACIDYLEGGLKQARLPADVSRLVREQLDRATSLLDDSSKPWDRKVGFIEGAVNEAKNALMGVTLDGKLKIVQGDITTAPVQGIVNAANTSLRLGGGVAGTIYQRGGQQVQNDCYKITNNGSRPIEMGKVAVTSGGNMPQTILHAAVMDWGGTASFESVRRATRNIVLEAKARGLRSIAIPALGAGSGGLSAQESAAAIRKGLYDMVMELDSFDEIQMVVSDASVQAAFTKVQKLAA